MGVEQYNKSLHFGNFCFSDLSCTGKFVGEMWTPRAFNWGSVTQTNQQLQSKWYRIVAEWLRDH